MLVILLFINWLALFGVVLVYSNDAHGHRTPLSSAPLSSAPLRSAIVCSTLLFCLQCFVMNELLSLFQQFRRFPLAMFYLFDTVVFAWLVFRKRSEWSSIIQKCRGVSFDPFIVRCLIASGILILLPLLCQVFLYPVTTWDAMTYHLPRVEHWLQNHNIAHYPTMTTRQLFVQPFPEYLISHFFLFSANDSWANLVQWLGLIHSLVLASLIARQFQLNGRGQLLAAMLALSIPMAICQATGTQVDLITSFFILSICYFGIALIRPADENRLIRCVFFGISLGLGALTKATIALYVVPFCLWFAVAYSRWFSATQWLKHAALVVAIFFVINGPYFYRNFSLCDHPFGDPILQNQLKNEPITFRNTLSNMMRTTASQMALPNRSFNLNLQNAVESIHKQLGWDVNARNSTFADTQFSVIFICCETWVSAFPAWAFLGIGSVVFALRSVAWAGISRRLPYEEPPRDQTGKRHTKKKTKHVEKSTTEIKSLQNGNATVMGFAGLYLLCLLSGFVLFSTVLKWSPWSGRLLLPWYMTGTPFVAFAFSTEKNDRLKSLFCVCCLGIALSVMVLNIARGQMQFHLGIGWQVEIDNSENAEFPIRLPDNLQELAPISVRSDKPGASWPACVQDRPFYCFCGRSDIMLDHVVLNEYLKRGGYRNIGLAFEPMNTSHDRDPWEYMIFRILKNDGIPHRIEHVYYPDYMKKTPNYDPEFVPEVIASGLYDIAPLERIYDLAESIPCGYLRLYHVRGVRED